MRVFLFLLMMVMMLTGCMPDRYKAFPNDPSSFANVDGVWIKHMDLNLNVDFEKHILSGVVSMDIGRRLGVGEMILDTRMLTIKRVTLNHAGADRVFKLGPAKGDFGRALTIALDDTTQSVQVYYSTSPKAPALQWLDPQQTAGKKHHFLFSQSEAILARSWVPCQDTPEIRFTYNATVQVKPGLLALMSASNPQKVSADGLYHFKMDQPVPSYLLALAVGDIAFKPFDERSGVYAEPSVLERAAAELDDTPDMIAAAESLYGPYRWGRYDILVLPPSFPYGGMENPRLTFATPTILAGDKSLVSLIAHELAHSWSGNLVTNANWNNTWLNEGFTNYFELRIMEKLYGRSYEEMLAQLEYQELKNAIAEMGKDNPDTRLAMQLNGRNPDEGLSNIAYDKGCYFLRMSENYFTRAVFDSFLQGYFNKFAFHSMTTKKFLAYYREKLTHNDTRVERELQLRKWIFEPGLPDNCPVPDSPEFQKVDKQRTAFLEGNGASTLKTQGWTTQHWLYFLQGLPHNLSLVQMTALDRAFGFTKSGNSEILFAWFMKAINRNYEPAYPALKHFLLTVGRAKFVPLYAALNRTQSGRKMALDIYKSARSEYHSLTYKAVDRILNKNK